MQGKGDFLNVDLKDDVGIKVIERLYNQKFKKYIYYYWIQIIHLHKIQNNNVEEKQILTSSHELHFVIRPNSLHKHI